MNHKDKTKFGCIEGARAVGAFTVVVWHLYIHLDVYFDDFSLRYIFRGEWANIFFFILSGFLAAYTMKDKKLPRVSEFCKKRIKKVYPLWLMTTSFFFILSMAEFLIRSEISITNISTLLFKTVIDIFLIQSWIPGYPYLFDLNGPGWFLSSMLLLWILTIPMLKIIQRMERKQKKAFLVGIIIIQIVWDFARMNIGIMGRYATGVWWLYPISSYVVGLLFGSEFRSEKVVNKYSYVISSHIFIICGIIICYFVTFNITFIENAVLIIYMMYLIWVLASEKSSLCKIMSNKLLVFIGGISFEIYMLHIPIDRFLGFFGFIHNEVVSFIVVVCLTVLAAIIWNKIMSWYRQNNSRRTVIS